MLRFTSFFNWSLFFRTLVPYTIALLFLCSFLLRWYYATRTAYHVNDSILEDHGGKAVFPHPPLRVLFIFSHPDDEAMFMTPTLYDLRQKNAEIYWICLSKGNSGGLGNVRRNELFASAVQFDVPKSRVYLVDDDRLPDGMTTTWPPSIVAFHINEALIKWGFLDNRATSIFTKWGRFSPFFSKKRRSKLKIAQKLHAMFTFDDFGVSGHRNHIDTHKGVVHWWRQYGSSVQLSQSSVQPTSIFLLRTNSVLPKYSGWLWTHLILRCSNHFRSIFHTSGTSLLHVLYKLWGSRRVQRSTSRNLEASRDGPKLPTVCFICRNPVELLCNPRNFLLPMKMHGSQFYLFRYFFVLFSSYSLENAWDIYVPTLKKDVEC